MPEKYCMYLRKSRADMEAEAHGEMETLARHKRALLELANRQHIVIDKIYSEIVSGESIAARPVMQQLLADVEVGLWEGVFVMEVERLARGDTIDQGIVAQTFKFANTKIITPTKTYDPNNEFDEEYFEFGLFMSRREYKTINRRLQNGRLASVKEGKYVANRPPYGYNRKKLDNEKGYTLEPNSEQAPIVKMIYELYTKGELQEDGSYERIGTNLIARRLNKMKVPSQRGSAWMNDTIRGILTNPVYNGKIRWNWRPVTKSMSNGQLKKERPRNNETCTIVNGLHKPIIDDDTWNLAQFYIAKNPPRPTLSPKNPLSGLIICGKCGRTMVRRPYPSRQDALICYSPECDNVGCDLHYVEERILKVLGEWLGDYKIKWEASTLQDDSTQSKLKQRALKKLTDEIEKLEKQLSNVYDLLEQGVYTSEVFLDRSKNLAKRIQQAKSDCNVLEKEIQQEDEIENGRKNIIPKVEHLLAVYYSLPDAKAKNDMLKEVLEKVVYTKKVSGRWNGQPDDFEIVLYPRIHNHI